MRKIVFVNRKGGVGKTTSAVNVSAALARSGHRTLVIDADSQANTTYVLGPQEYQYTITDVLLGNIPAHEAIVATAEENLYLLAGEERFANFPNRAREVNEVTPQLVMRQKLAGLADFDYVVVDVPTSLDLTTVNSLAYCDEAWVPIDPMHFSVQGLHRLVRVIDQLRENFHITTITLNGIFLTLADHRTVAVEQVLEYLKTNFPNLTCQTVISRLQAVPSALSRRMSIFAYDAKSKSAKEYLSLTQEILAYEQQPQLQARAGGS